MIFKWSVLYSCALLSICEASFVENLKKSSLSDDTGLRNLIQSVLNELSNGVKEYNIKPVDPAEIHNVKITILNLLDFTVKDGVVTGIKDCKIDRMHADFEGKGEAEFTCDIKLKGTYSASAASPEVQKIFGGKELHGDGNIEVDATKLNIKVKFFFEFIKKENGETYAKLHREDAVLEYDIADFKVSLDNLYMGDQDASDLVAAYINKNFKPLMKIYGQSFVNSAVEIIYDILNKLSEIVPTKYYLTDDVTPYVKD